MSAIAPATTSADDAIGHSGMGRRPGLMAWVLLSPLLLWLLALVVLPTAIMVVFSFCQHDPAGLGAVVYEFTTTNYTRLLDRHQAMQLLWSIAAGFGAMAITIAVCRRLQAPIFTPAIVAFLGVFWILLNGLTLFGSAELDAGQWLKITVVSVNYAAVSTAICVLLGYPVAYFIGKAPDRWRNILLMMVMVPFWTSFLVRTYAWMTIFRFVQNHFSAQLAWVNDLLLRWHLIERAQDLYPSQLGVMIGLVYTYLPFMILPIYTSVERLDNALVEAAFDLGASPFRAFRGVILPLTRPGIIAGIVLVFVPAVGMFAVNDILGGGQEMLIGNVIQRQFMIANDKPFGSAFGIVLLILFVITYALTMRRREVAN